MSRDDETPAGPGAETLRVLSYNIQAGVATTRYRQYVTRSWRFVVPHEERWRRLALMARRLAAYDLVALQETDAGSFRTGFTNTTEFLARHADFPYWFEQVNRRIGALTSHGNGLLCRIRPREVIDSKLPGLRGRGVLAARYRTGDETFGVFVVHLALGRRTRDRQLAYLAELVREEDHGIVLGDLNCVPSNPGLRRLLETAGLEPPDPDRHTFPSWRPRRAIDHILVSRGIRVLAFDVLPWPHSDHYPVAMDLALPGPIGP